MHRFSISGVVLIAILTGCGGNPVNRNPCADDFLQANAAYAGTYTGHFHDSTSGTTPRDLDFTLTLDLNGNLAGNVVEDQTGRTSAVTGRLIDWIFPCANDLAIIQVDFQFPNDQTRRLTGERDRGFVQPWPFRVEYELGSSNIGDGFLILTKQ